MTGSTFRNRFSTVKQQTTRWLPIPIRGVVALVLAPAAVLKFINYSGEVTAFASYGIPVPEVTVLLVGVIEMVAAVSIAFGVAGRLGAVTMLPVMGTAMLTAGIVLSNVTVFVGCLVILVVGTGDYAIVEIESQAVDRFRRASP